jgi:3-oxoacyl-[acyl-carrier-protein] synthase II
VARRRVVVTGLGIISPVGNTVQETWDNIVAGRSGIGRSPASMPAAFKSRIAGEVKNFDVSAYLPPKEARRMDVFIHYGMAAGIQAIKDSGLDGDPENAVRIGVNIGSGIGGLPMIEDTHNDFLGGGPRKISPFFIPGTIINMISGNLLDHVRAEGAEPCGGDGLHHGLARHRHRLSHDPVRRCRRDGLRRRGIHRFPLAIGGFASAQALSTRNDDPATASRPWDKDRDGFVLGEGAGVLVLEEFEHAMARGAKIYAELSGFGMSGDAFHMTAPDTDGPRRSMVNALKGCGVNADQVHYLNAHGTSTPLGDKNETDAIKLAFGDAAKKTGGEFHQVDDRPPAGRRRRPGIGIDRARRASPGFAADHQHLQPGSGVRPRLLRQHGASDEDRRRAEEQFRLRRHQRTLVFRRI